LYDHTVKQKVSISMVLLCKKHKNLICCLAFQLYCKYIWLQWKLTSNCQHYLVLSVEQRFFSYFRCISFGISNWFLRRS